MYWILLVVMFGADGSVNPAIHEFTTQAKCEQAAEWFNNASRLLKVKTTCLPKN